MYLAPALGIEGFIYCVKRSERIARHQVDAQEINNVGREIALHTPRRRPAPGIECLCMAEQKSRADAE